jgi:tyrosine-protein phosphatase SIW14
MDDDQVIIPENFSMVSPGIYRSSFPKRKNFSFLKKLKLKTVLTLILEDYPIVNSNFLQENSIKLYQFGVAGNKEPFVDIPEDKVYIIIYARSLMHCTFYLMFAIILVRIMIKLQY